MVAVVVAIAGFIRHPTLATPTVAVPLPHLAQVEPEPTAAPELTAAPPLPIAGTYSDPAAQFSLAIVEGYSVGTAGDSPLFEAADGQTAYTAAVTPVAFQSGVSDLDDDVLVSLATRKFGGGEGFTLGEVIENPAGGVAMDWTGQVTVGRSTQPLTGKILVQQSGETVVMLLISATEAGQATLPDLMATLTGTLELS